MSPRVSRAVRLSRSPAPGGAPARSVRIGRAASRERILAAAVAEFAERGFAGARVDVIASRAGINKRMLYAYVGNKRALWLAALLRVYEAKREQERRIDLQRLSPTEGIQVLIRFNFRYHTDHPEFLAMLNDENLQRGATLKGSRHVAELYSPLLKLISRLLARGQAQGVFRKGVDPVQLYVSIMALGYFYCSNQHTLAAVFGHRLDTVEELLAREQHCVDVIMGYLRP